LAATSEPQAARRARLIAELLHNADFPHPGLHTVLHSRQGWLARPHSLPRSLRSWLSDRGSLTLRLKARSASFRVVPLATGLARPNPDEYALLGMAPGSRAYVREVLLLCNEVPVVFAHSVLPHASLRGGWSGITRLGSRSLGEALFSNHRIQRQPLAYRHVRRGHPLFRAVARQQVLAVHSLWARRSVFCLNGHPLLVTEVFLPAIDAL
jgi:chorismate--pyruvate lyase